MGEVSHVKVGGPKPRPLGLVKRESVHFEDVDSANSTFLPASENTNDHPVHSYYLLGRSKTESSLRHDLKSMRDLQETLRQAALLNIVAAVNHDTKPSDPMPTSRAGIKGANLLGQPVTGNGKLLLTHNAGDLTSGHFSRHLQTANSTVSGALTMPQHSSLTQLLSARPRIISIPRPRTHGEQAAFMHNNLMDAKEQLTNMTNFRARPRQDTASTLSPSANLTGTVSAESRPDTKPSDTEFRPSNLSQDMNKSTDFSKTPYGYRVSGPDSQANFTLSSKGDYNLECPPPTRQVPIEHEDGTKKMTKEEQRAHNVHQMQMLKRHISTNKKKELMKKLSEIAKCEAVDMNEHIATADDSGPIIISAQTKALYAANQISPEYLASAHNVLRRPISAMSPQKEETSRVPSNTRVQSETVESINQYRETKRKGSFHVGDDLKIEGILGVDRVNQETIFGGPNGSIIPQLIESYPTPNDVSNWLRDNQFGDTIVGKNLNLSDTPEVLELRPVDQSTPQQMKSTIADRRRAVIIRRSLNPTVREKLLSPSPMVYEASYHRPKASMGQISLVGQSLPSLSICKPSTFSTKASVRKGHDGNRPPSRANTTSVQNDDVPVRSWNDTLERQTRQTMKPWGSTAKPATSSSPIFKTEILDHLQCKGITDRRPIAPNPKKSISKIKGQNKVPGENGSEDDFDEDDEVGLETSKPANYRKSKLYSAFRASEENLATMVDTASMVSDTLTARSLLNQQNLTHAKSEGDLKPFMPLSDPVQALHKEPRYMGCSSRVSEGEVRSQFHMVNGNDEAEPAKGTNFKVFKALDQDVYFDFQHRKYRGGNSTNTTLNTGTNKPRMHFLKIKYSGEAKS